MVSQTTINILGIIGGVVLAICQAPQLWKLWRTKSAADLSYWYLVLYSIGLLFITVYLYLEGATVGWICEAIETVCGFALIIAKYYYDEWGPLSARGKQRRAEGKEGAQGGALSGAPSQAALLPPQVAHAPPPPGSDKDSDGSESCAVSVGGGEAVPAGGTPAGSSTRRLRERRRSHDALPI